MPRQANVTLDTMSGDTPAYPLEHFQDADIQLLNIASSGLLLC
jgi:hypothetical protein